MTTGSAARSIAAISGGSSRPRWRAVRTTLARTCWVSAPWRVRLPPHTLRMTTAGRMACSARQLVAPSVPSIPREVSRQAGAMPLQHEAHRARLTDGRHPVPGALEAGAEVREGRACIVQPALRVVEHPDDGDAARREVVVGAGQRQQGLAGAAGASRSDQSNLERAEACRVGLLRRVEQPELVGHGLQLRQASLVARYGPGRELSLIGQQRALRIVRLQLPPLRHHLVLGAQAPGGEQRPRGCRARRVLVRRGSGARRVLDVGDLTGEGRQRVADLRSGGRCSGAARRPPPQAPTQPHPVADGRR